MSTAAQNHSPGTFRSGEESVSTRRTIPAWMLSTGLHLVLIVTLAMVVRSSPRGANVEADRSGGIVLVENRRGDVEYFSESDADSAGDSRTSESAAQDVAAALPTSSRVPVNIAGLRPSSVTLAGAGQDLNAALPDVSGLLDGVGPSRSVGGKTTTQVFGLQGTGSKFVYVFDRSGSMSAENGRPLKAAKSQMIASLQSLKSTDQFQIIFYNERPLSFNPFPGKSATLMFGTEENKELARRFIERVSASGGTQHLPALKIALNMTPDVIFFLTDANEPRMTSGELKDVRRWNKVTSINSIEFGTRPYPRRGNFLFKLAEQNNGDYVYRNVAELKVGE